MLPHLILKQGKQQYLLFRTAEAFQLVDINGSLTREKRQQILTEGCTPSQMQQMGLSGMTIAISDLEGVAIYGYATGEDFEFHFGKKKLCYKLAKRCEQAQMDAFFRGVPRIPTPARPKVRGGSGKDWRMSEQTPEGRKQMRKVGITANVVGVLIMAGMLICPQYFHLLSVAALIFGIFGAFLGIVYPEYFIFLNQKDYRKSGGKAKVMELQLPFLPLYVVTLMSLNRYFYFDLAPVLIYGVVLGLVIGFVMFLLSQELKENLAMMFAVVFLAAFIGVGVVAHTNHMLAGEEPVPHTVPIVDMYVDHNRRGADDYICTVRFPDGREMDIEVPRTAYERYALGDTIVVPLRTGAWGIEYAFFGYED